MSRAIYYLKCRFANAEAAEAALPLIRAFMAEGIEARAWWDAQRSLKGKDQRRTFWRRFQGQFPLVDAYLGERAGGAWDDALAPFLEFGAPDRTELSCEDKFIKYKAEVWREADWSPLEEFLKAHFGALGTAFIGDEPGFDLFTILNP